MTKFVLALLLVGGVTLVWLYLHPTTTDRTTDPVTIPINGTSGTTPGEKTTSSPGNTEDDTLPYEIEVTPLAVGLEIPRAVVQTSPSRYLVTERPGRVRAIVDGQLRADPVLTLPGVVSSSEEGLLSIVLDPEYATNQYVYLSYTYREGSTTRLKVERRKDAGTQLTEPMVVLDFLPAAKWHAGSALAFGPDGKLYITVGDATERTRAQSLDTSHGKILRINTDGTIPADNPFPDSAIWSYGHRNSQGIDRTSAGMMYASEHGPSTFDGPPGGDEINRIIAGSNYGWPTISHEKTHAEMVSPLAIYTPAVAPASLHIYRGEIFPARKDHLFVGLLRGEGILHLTIDPADPDTILQTEKLVDKSYGRIRFVGETLDGSLLFTTSNEDGRGTKRAEKDGVYLIKKK